MELEYPPPGTGDDLPARMSQQTEAPPSAWEATPVEFPADPLPASPLAEHAATNGDALDDAAVAEARRLDGLRLEVTTLRLQLEASHASESRLQAELAATEKALEYTKSEVANLWRAMTTRNLKDVARKAVADARQDSRLVRLSDERARIQSKIADVRSLARRRRWPWSLVG